MYSSIAWLQNSEKPRKYPIFARLLCYSILSQHKLVFSELKVQYTMLALLLQETVDSETTQISLLFLHLRNINLFVKGVHHLKFSFSSNMKGCLPLQNISLCSKGIWNRFFLSFYVAFRNFNVQNRFSCLAATKKPIEIWLF